MSVVIPMAPDEHAAVQALLPWYARGQLDDAESLQVQQHLLQCTACRQELAAEQPLQALLNVAGAPAPVGDVEAGLARLHARLAPAATGRATPRWVPWALGLQGAAVAVLLGVLIGTRSAEPAYEGLSAAGTAPVVADALVMFKPGTSEQAVRELLRAEQAGIVAGPTETGAWLLRVDARGLAALRSAPIVALAEPLQPGASR